MPITTKVLVLGLGNRLLGDDAAGPLVVARLAQLAPNAPGTQAAAAPHEADVAWRDGGTIGLALLPEIEDAQALIAVDAARFGAAPGTVQVFEAEAMDQLLVGRKRSAHEVALADLMGAAALSGALPARRALVAVEPACVELGLAPSPVVQRALPAMADAVLALLARWRLEDRPDARGGRATEEVFHA